MSHVETASPGATTTDVADLRERVAAVRRFDQFYTQRIGVLREGLLKSDYSLAEVRVLNELARRQEPTAAELTRDLGIDRAQMSRIVRRLERRGLLDRDVGIDGRAWLLELTSKGRRAFEALDGRSSSETAALLQALSAADQQRLVRAMATIETILGGRSEVPTSRRITR
jgi:DNA-binding MarR family transcriptional regulator